MIHHPFFRLSLFILMGLAILMPLAPGCSKPEPGPAPDGGDRGSEATRDLPITAVAASDFGYTNGWARSMNVPRGQEITSAVVLGDLVVLVEQPVGIVTGLSANTGSVRWVKHLGGPTERLMQPLRNADRVFFPTEVNMYSIDANTGGDLQIGQLPYPVQLPPAQADELAMFGSISGHLFAYSLRSNQSIYARDFTRQFLAPPVVSGDIVVAANESGWARAYNAETGKVRWTTRTFGSLKAAPAADAARVYIASSDQFLYALERSTGQDLWKFPTEQPLVDAPVVLGRTVYQFVEKRGLVALDAVSGEVQWELPTADQPLALTPDNRLLMLSKDRRELSKLNPETGATVETVRVQPMQEVLQGPDGSLILLTQGGVVHRLDPRK